MKLSMLLSCLAALASSASGENLRVRNLAGVSGSIDLCFSEKSTVQVLGKGTVAMKDLHVGDQVLTKDGISYEPVYAFAHRDETTETEFLQIATSSSAEPLELSVSHMVYVQGKQYPVPANSLKVGSVLQTGVQGATILSIDTVQRSGLYAPLTPSGNVWVNGIHASAYVNLQEGSTSEHWLLQANRSSGFSNQFLSNMFMSPFRMICMGVSSDLCQEHSQNGMSFYFAHSFKFSQWYQTLPTAVQYVLLAVVLVVFGSFYMLESLVGATYAPLVMVLVAMTCAVRKVRRSSSSPVMADSEARKPLLDV